MRLVRTFHPVGHGAFYTERFYEDNNPQPIFTAIFDCGCFEAAKLGTTMQFFQNQIENELQQTFNVGDRIDALFVSHFHTDHINGIDWLLKNCNVNRIFIPVLTPRVVLEAYLFNFIQTGSINNIGNSFIEDAYSGLLPNVSQIRSTRKSLKERRVEKINIARVYNRYLSPSSQLYHNSIPWLYIPFNLLAGQHIFLLFKNSPLKAIIKNGKIDFANLRSYLQTMGVGACQKIYTSHLKYKSKTKINHNSYSMTTLSYFPRSNGNYQIMWNNSYVSANTSFMNCLYMGDFEANDKYPKQNTNLKKLKFFYNSYWKNIGILQVPHHGSEHNYHDDLYDYQRHCIISHGMTDKYNHPDALVINGINRHQCLSLQVTEDPASKQTYMFII